MAAFRCVVVVILFFIACSYAARQKTIQQKLEAERCDRLMKKVDTLFQFFINVTRSTRYSAFIDLTPISDIITEESNVHDEIHTFLSVDGFPISKVEKRRLCSGLIVSIDHTFYHIHGDNTLQQYGLIHFDNDERICKLWINYPMFPDMMHKEYMVTKDTIKSLV